jgi:hypothetical protein
VQFSNATPTADDAEKWPARMLAEE